MFHAQTPFNSGVAKSPADMLEPNILLIIDMLRSIGIAKLDVSYYGGGDSGQVEEYNATPQITNISEYHVFQYGLRSQITYGHRALTDPYFQPQCSAAVWNYSQLDSSLKPVSLSSAVEEIWYTLLEHYFPGWEINEGSFGNLIFVIDPDQEGVYVSLDHNQHFLETTNHQFDIYGTPND